MPNEINVNLTAGRRTLTFSDAVIADYKSVLIREKLTKGFQWGTKFAPTATKQEVTALRSEAQGLARRIGAVKGLEFTVRTVKDEDGSQSIALVVIESPKPDADAKPADAKKA